MRKKISKLEKNACSDSPHLFRFAPIDGIRKWDLIGFCPTLKLVIEVFSEINIVLI